MNYLPRPAGAQLYVVEARCFVAILPDGPQLLEVSKTDGRVLSVNEDSELALNYLVQRLYQLILGYNLPPESHGKAYQEDRVPSDADLEGFRRNIMYLYGEVEELRNEVSWKWHRRNTKPVNRLSATMEVGDLYVFAMNALAHLGVPDYELVKACTLVQDKNYDRWRNGTNVGAPQSEDE